MQNDKYSDYSVETGYEEINEVEIAKPKMREIVILNDDYTSVQFVIDLLMEVFDKTKTDAQNITQFVHSTGEGSCGIYPYDIAELKHARALSFIRQCNMPLRLIMRDI